MKTEIDLVLTRDLREDLKIIMQQEIKDLSTTIKKLEPKDRINVLCKLMPYVFPKLDTIHTTDGEPMQW